LSSVFLGVSVIMIITCIPSLSGRQIGSKGFFWPGHVTRCGKSNTVAFFHAEGPLQGLRGVAFGMARAATLADFFRT
jgi:hypothetical protein